MEQDENVTISMIADWLDRGTQLKSIYVTSDYCEHGKRAKEPTQYLCKDDYEEGSCQKPAVAKQQDWSLEIQYELRHAYRQNVKILVQGCTTEEYCGGLDDGS